MADEPASKPFFSRCGVCDHVWISAYLPMELKLFAEICLSARCPKCGASGKDILIARQYDSEATNDEASHG